MVQPPVIFSNKLKRAKIIKELGTLKAPRKEINVNYIWKPNWASRKSNYAIYNKQCCIAKRCTTRFIIRVHAFVLVVPLVK